MRRAGSCCEAKVASEPEVLIGFLRGQRVEIGRVGLEAGPLSQWLHAALVGAGFEAVLLETRHVKAALSAMTVKTDRRDARGIAQLLRLGWYRPVHAKSASAQEVRALLTARKLIQGKLLDIESGIRGVLRGFGLKVGSISRGRFDVRIRELVDGQAMLETVVGSMLAARAALQQEFARLHRTLLGLVRADPVCRQLMSVPGVVRSSPSRSRAASTTLAGSGDRVTSVRTLASRRGSTSRASSM